MVKKKLLFLLLWLRRERYFLSFLRESSGENKAEYSEKRPADTKKVLSNDNYQTDNKNDVWGQMERF